MAAVSASPERTEVSQLTEPSPSRLASDVASESLSTARPSFSTDTLDRSHSSNSSPNPLKDFEVQSPASLRSEEYRQLFRLPADEVLVEDFNCALQENILIQGHMYLFVQHICFYSNIFGFETKKIIPFNEVTSVKRAKTAGIFPNAIEIVAGGKKESMSESSSQGNEAVLSEKVDSSRQLAIESDYSERNKDPPELNDSQPLTVEVETVSAPAAEQQDNVLENAEPVVNAEPSSSKETCTWKQENFDAPKIPESYTKVAESKFPIKVEDFFSLFFSDDSVAFIEAFHKRCGDKDFRCSSWYPHEKFGHTRDLSFQHPIKVYFGAKLGSCHEIQKFRVYENSHLVVETSQEISDVPYADYFRVEGLWDVERDSNESKEGCILRIYVNVAFSKKTVWKGKIVQSTNEECREAYLVWISMAHELLKQNNLENKEEGESADRIIGNGQVHFESEVKTGESSERLSESSDHIRAQQISEPMDANQQVGNLFQGNFVGATSLGSWLREFIKKLGSLKSQNQISVLAVIVFAVIFLMQMSILVLLARPQHIHVNPQADYMSSMGNGVGGRSSEAMAWMDKRIHHLKDEMYVVESRLERMRHEHSLLKEQLKDLEQLRKQR